MTSIPGNFETSHLPDFRTVVIWLRIIGMVNAGLALGILAANQGAADIFNKWVAAAVFVEPLILLCLSALYLVAHWLAQFPRRAARALVVLMVLLATAALHGAYDMLGGAQFGLDTAALWAALSAYLVLVWLDLLERAQTPALAEARLLALTARIRPHFLFNTLNAVLGVMRTEPKRAETAIEELSDLFRVLMRENRTLVPLSEEIAVARQYLNLERLRLGDRIQVQWDMTSCPPDPMVPPLMLQPLLENAVYHGIEPSQTPGDILIRCEQVGDKVRLELSNSMALEGRQSQGNQMALTNIRERLLLFFQLEAVMTTSIRQNRFYVLLEFPYQPNDAA